MKLSLVAHFPIILIKSKAQNASTSYFNQYNYIQRYLWVVKRDIKYCRILKNHRPPARFENNHLTRTQRLILTGLTFLMDAHCHWPNLISRGPEARAYWNHLRRFAGTPKSPRKTRPMTQYSGEKRQKENTKTYKHLCSRWTVPPEDLPEITGYKSRAS